MIIQQIDPIRLFTVFFVQLTAAFILLFIAFLLLRRKINRLSLTASSFYITLAISFLINPFYLLILSNPAVYIIYFLTIYLMFLSPIFLLTFLIVLVKSKVEFKVKTQLVTYLGYGVLLFCILLFVPKITIDESNNWRPIWSIPLFVAMLILAIVITIVASTFLIKILQSMKKVEIRKKWILFSIGFVIFTFDMFGFLIYCVWYDLLFRTIWSFVSITLILGAILMYYTFGQNLQKQE